MNSSNTLKTSNANSSNLKCSPLTCTDYSNFTGWQNKIDNISSTKLPCNCGSYARLYGGTLRYDTVIPSGGYITNDINNTYITSTTINCTNISSTGIQLLCNI